MFFSGAEGGAALPPAYDASEAGAVGGRSPVDAFDMSKKFRLKKFPSYHEYPV